MLRKEKMARVAGEELVEMRSEGAAAKTQSFQFYFCGKEKPLE